MSREDTDLVLDFLKSRKSDFEQFLKTDRGLSPHAATFIIEDLEYELKVKIHDRKHGVAQKSS
jgi:hypothetical protein